MAERNRTSRNNKMKRVQCVDEDVSSSDEPDPKRFMNDNSGSTKRRLKSKLIKVMVLFHRDVRKENGRVHLLKGKLGQLRKPERGQYKTRIPITTDMTKTIVEKQLRLQLPIVGDKGRLSCATAVDNRERLEFHNSPERVEDDSGTVWDGAGTLLDDPGTLQDCLGTGWDDPGTSCDDPGTSWDDQGTSWDDPGTSWDYPGTSWDDPGTSCDDPGTSWDDQGTSWDDPGTSWDDPGTSWDDLGTGWDDPGTEWDGTETVWDGTGTVGDDPGRECDDPGIVCDDPRTVWDGSGTVWDGSGTVWDGTKINRLIKGNSVLYVLFERTPESVNERPEPPKVNSCLLQDQMPELTDSPFFFSKKLKELKRKHDSSSSTVPEVQNLGASVKKQVLQSTSYSKGSKEGGQQSHQEQGDDSVNPTAGLLGPGLRQSSVEDHSKESQEVNKVRRSVENNATDSAYESTTGNTSGVDDNTEHSKVIIKLCPDKGPITGGTEFVICLDVKGIPENITSLQALFEGVGYVNLTPVTEGVYTGRSRASKITGNVTVTVHSPDGTWNSPNETEFIYHPVDNQQLHTLIAKVSDEQLD
ncbi:uncharacterized protein [Pocillopora verrucosa]|uniref:uncharacterized protein isoform X4 n=1 Tax=Pocillopora verrucosa TaxID=203993 RepID=UPI0033411B4A